MRRLRKSKVVTSLANMPQGKLLSIEEGYNAIILVYKILLMASPFYLLGIPFILYIYLKDSFLYGTIVIALMYIVVLEDYFFRRSIVGAIQNVLKGA